MCTKIHAGPIWSVDTVAQGASTSGQTSMKPTEVQYPNLDSLLPVKHMPMELIE